VGAAGGLEGARHRHQQMLAAVEEAQALKAKVRGVMFHKRACLHSHRHTLHPLPHSASLVAGLAQKRLVVNTRKHTQTTHTHTERHAQKHSHVHVHVWV